VWPATFHVIGKDILVPPHAVYWPIMLKAAGIEPPKSLLVHGWWSINGAKMSKSKGNFVDPIAFADQYGADALRFFLIREMSVGQDSDLSNQQFLARYNSELANNLGNLVNRTLNDHRCRGRITGRGGRRFRARTQGGVGKWRAIRSTRSFSSHLARAHLAFVTATNAYIEKRAPWKLGKSTEARDQALLRTSLATMGEALRLAVTLLAPVMPATRDKVLGLLGSTPTGTWRDQLEWGASLTGAKVGQTAILFPKPTAPVA
jgi:methionyl-tRNA synthetase